MQVLGAALHPVRCTLLISLALRVSKSRGVGHDTLARRMEMPTAQYVVSFTWGDTPRSIPSSLLILNHFHSTGHVTFTTLFSPDRKTKRNAVGANTTQLWNGVIAPSADQSTMSLCPLNGELYFQEKRFYFKTSGSISKKRFNDSNNGTSSTVPPRKTWRITI